MVLNLGDTQRVSDADRTTLAAALDSGALPATLFILEVPPDLVRAL